MSEEKNLKEMNLQEESELEIKSPKTKDSIKDVRSRSKETLEGLDPQITDKLEETESKKLSDLEETESQIEKESEGAVRQNDDSEWADLSSDTVPEEAESENINNLNETEIQIEEEIERTVPQNDDSEGSVHQNEDGSDGIDRQRSTYPYLFSEYLLKLAIVFFTALGGALVLNTDDQYLNFGSRVSNMLFGKKMVALEFEPNVEDNTILIVNANNSKVFVSRLEFVSSSSKQDDEVVSGSEIVLNDMNVRLISNKQDVFATQSNAPDNNNSVIPETGPSTSYYAEYDFSSFNENKDSKILMKANSKDSPGDPAYILELNPREVKNISMDIFNNSKDVKENGSIIEGYFEITYFIHEKKFTSTSADFLEPYKFTFGNTDDSPKKVDTQDPEQPIK